jgi:hypothetical protein
MAYIGKQPVVGNFVKLDAITTSATATYNLLNGGVAYFPQTANNCIVSLNGVIQSPTSAYTISGSTIVFSDALTASDSIDFILVLGDVLNIGTPSDATVGFAKVTSNLITGATSETSIAGGDSVLIYDDSAAALRKMTRTNFVAGVGGTNTPSFFAYKTSDQTISDSTLTKVVTASNTLSVSITPASTSNKIFVLYTGAVQNVNNTNSTSHFTIFRGATNLGGGTNSALASSFDPQNNMVETIAMGYLDSPNTTSSTTYQVQFKNDNGTNVTLNAQGTLGSITAFEVKG